MVSHAHPCTYWYCLICVSVRFVCTPVCLCKCSLWQTQQNCCCVTKQITPHQGGPDSPPTIHTLLLWSVGLSRCRTVQWLSAPTDFPINDRGIVQLLWLQYCDIQNYHKAAQQWHICLASQQTTSDQEKQICSYCCWLSVWKIMCSTKCSKANTSSWVGSHSKGMQPTTISHHKAAEFSCCQWSVDSVTRPQTPE